MKIMLFPKNPVFQAVLLLASVMVAGCAPGDGEQDGRDDRFLGGDSKADAFGVGEWTSQALGILDLVNQADQALLTGPVGIALRTANSLLQYRAGDDGLAGTWDDHEITSLAELDEVPWVGPVAFGKLRRFADERGYTTDWPLQLPAAGRLVAIGDLHGDLAAARSALRTAGAIDRYDRWIGGDLIVVQVGDILDRGDQEREILELFDRLEQEAQAAGGAFIMLLGNHEVMNVSGDYRYVTEAGLTEFDDQANPDTQAFWLDEYSAEERGRASAFLQGGPFARCLTRHQVALLAGGSLFVHAGILPWHLDTGLQRINFQAKAWMLWDDLEIPELLDSEEGPVWYRGYGEDETTECDLVEQVLAQTGQERMVVGHSVQESGITTACDGRLWRIDVGMSSYYGGEVEVLEIQGDQIAVLPR